MSEPPVVVDISALQSPESRGRGIAHYALSWCNALERLRPDLVAIYGLNPWLAPPGDLHGLVASGKVAHLDQHTARRAQIFHQLAPFDLAQPVSRLLPSKAPGQLTSATIYDLIPAHSLTTELVDPIDRRRYRTRLELVRSLDGYQVLSNGVATDLTRILGIARERIAVVGAAPGSDFVPPPDREAVRNSVIASMAHTTLNRRYVLYPSGSHPRKNNERLVRAWALVPDRIRSAFQLVITGAFDASTVFHLEHLAAQLGTPGEVVIAGYVADRNFVALVQGADLVCFPSLAEGFGLPVVEALACETRVIASSIAPLDELLDGHELFDPGDAQAIAEAIGRALTESTERVTRASTTWGNVARASAGAFDAMLDGARARRAPRPSRRRRPRLAIVSPFPNSPTGIARYSYRLSEALARTEKVDLTCFFDGPTTGQIAPDGLTAHRVESLMHVERLTGRFDEVIYVFGNSHHHLGALSMLRRRRGVVMSHDVRLSNLYRHLTGDPGFLLGGLGRSIEQMYQGQLPRSIGATGDLDEHDLEQYGILMARDIISMSSGFLVTSTAAAQLARIDARPNALRRIAVLPFAMEVPVPNDVGFHEDSTACPAILMEQPGNLWGKPPPRDQTTYLAHFGIVDPIKRPVLLVEMLAALTARAEVRLVFVGPVADALCSELVNRARALGIGERVLFTGPLGARDYLSWLERVAIALQLRAKSNGEASAAIGECLAGAVPTVVSDLGWSGELPEDAVVRVDTRIDAHDLANVTLQLLDDSRRATEIARTGATYASHFSFDYVARTLLAKTIDSARVGRAIPIAT